MKANGKMKTVLGILLSGALLFGALDASAQLTNLINQGIDRGIDAGRQALIDQAINRGTDTLLNWAAGQIGGGITIPAAQRNSLRSAVRSCIGNDASRAISCATSSSVRAQATRILRPLAVGAAANQLAGQLPGGIGNDRNVQNSLRNALNSCSTVANISQLVSGACATNALNATQSSVQTALVNSIISGIGVPSQFRSQFNTLVRNCITSAFSGGFSINAIGQAQNSCRQAAQTEMTNRGILAGPIGLPGLPGSFTPPTRGAPAPINVAISGPLFDEETRVFRTKDNVELQDIREENKRPMLSEGYNRSTILFNPAETDTRERYYPKLAGMDGQPNYLSSAAASDIAANGLNSVINIGVDDEINRATMAVYTPIYMMDKDFAEDRTGRNRHLDLFRTVRGISILTLSYLDKTVAAGLATVQQQADNNAQNLLLQQIAWSSKRLANPKQEAMYVDIDEKIEACMARDPALGGSDKSGRAGGSLSCGSCVYDAPDPQALGGADGTGGLFNYCVCCAMQSQRPNPAVEGTTTYSLVDRALLGTLPAQGLQSGKVNNLITEFKTQYGDVNLIPQENRTRFSYAFPGLSVADRIELIRDGTECEGSNCPFTGLIPVNTGICSALNRFISECVMVTGTNSGSATTSPECRHLIQQSSIGEIMNYGDIDNLYTKLLNVMGNASVPVGAGQRLLDAPRADVTRWVRELCDASAVGVFRRYHARLSAAVEDHLLMNRKITTAETALMRDLMNRVSTQLELAEVDRNASSVASTIKRALETEDNQQAIAVLQAISRAMQQSSKDGQAGTAGSQNPVN